MPPAGAERSALVKASASCGSSMDSRPLPARRDGGAGVWVGGGGASGEMRGFFASLRMTALVEVTAWVEVLAWRVAVARSGTMRVPCCCRRFLWCRWLLCCRWFLCCGGSCAADRSGAASGSGAADGSEDGDGGVVLVGCEGLEEVELVAGEEADLDPAEEVIHDGFGVADLLVAGPAGGLEAGVGELFGEDPEGDAVLEGEGDGGGEGVHEAGDGGAFLGHADEDFAGAAVGVEADGDVAFVAADARTCG